MLQPKKVRYRRPQKGRMKAITKRGAEISFGSFALKTLDEFWISARQIEAARQAITREMKRQGQLWIRIFPDRPVTAKGLGVRMGKGKGTPESWAAREPGPYPLRGRRHPDGSRQGSYETWSPETARSYQIHR